jgi:hypothetical protein
MKPTAQKKHKKPARITPDVLKSLQQALNDSIKPDLKYKSTYKDAPNKKPKNRRKPEEKK